MTDTSTTHNARDHARAQAGLQAEFQKMIPVTQQQLAPDGVSADAMLWAETIAPGNYAIQKLPSGSRLRLTDRDGDGCAQLLVYNAKHVIERLNIADTVKVQWQAYFGKGQLLLSDMGRVLMTALEDTCAGHDTFNAMSNLAWNTTKFGSGDVHGKAPNARDLFSVALAKQGMSRRDICPCINLFKKVLVDSDGSFAWHGEDSPRGGELTLRCETDVLVAVTVTPHVLDPRTEYLATPVTVTAWRGQPAQPDDPFRSATPEGLRAFQNTEDYNLSAQHHD